MTLHFPTQQACPMNGHPHGRSGRTVQEIWEDFSLSFTPAVREVVEFAKHIPGFRELSQHDQVSLLKAGTFEVGAICPFFYRKGLYGVVMEYLILQYQLWKICTLHERCIEDFWKKNI